MGKKVKCWLRYSRVEEMRTDMWAQKMPSQDGEGGEWIKRVKGKRRVVLHRHVSTGRGALFVICQRKDGERKSCLSSIVHRRELAH